VTPSKRSSSKPRRAAAAPGYLDLPPELARYEGARAAVLPCPFDGTSTYGKGADLGPARLLEASGQVEFYDLALDLEPCVIGIATLPAVKFRSDDPAAAVAAIEKAASRPVADGKFLLGLGGEHSVSIGLTRAVRRHHGRFSLLHVDAHADLRVAYEGFRWSHASIMWNVFHELAGVARIVQVGVRDLGLAENALIQDNPGRLRTYFDADLRQKLFEGEGWGRLAGRIVADLPKDVYVSFDIDGLDPALCPHTGTPVAGGLSFAEAACLLRTVAESGRRIVGFDLTEVAPDPAGASEWDGNVGARVLYKQIGFALRSLGA
jgi:agmatinase